MYCTKMVMKEIIFKFQMVKNIQISLQLDAQITIEGASRCNKTFVKFQTQTISAASIVEKPILIKSFSSPVFIQSDTLSA